MKHMGKQILVSGASSGIGKSVCEKLAAEGAVVIATARNEERLNTLIDSLRGDLHISRVCDLTNENSIQALVKSIDEIDGFVHCAGMVELIPAKYISIEKLRKVMSVNFESAVMLVSYLLRLKKLKKQSSLVFISSQAAEKPLFGSSAYSASKAAIESFSRNLADELQLIHGRSNCIAPAYVRTPMTEDATNPFSGEFMNRFAAIHPEGVGESSQVSSIISFLLSDDSSWINGQVINAGRFSINIPGL